MVACAGYLCGVGYCKQNPKFALPAIPEGCVGRTVQNAAAGFSGYTTGFATPEELPQSKGYASPRQKSILRKTFQYRLFTTRLQSERLHVQLGEACRLYHAALQEHRDAWKLPAE